MSYKTEHEIWLDELQRDRRARPGMVHVLTELAAASLDHSRTTRSD